MKSTLKCIKEVSTKNGLKFNKGESYSYVVCSKGLRVYINSDKSVVLKSDKVVNKYFI